MGRSVVVIVDKHGCANEVLTRRADATDARVLMTDFRPQGIFGMADAFAPNIAGVAQLDFVFADVKIGRLIRPARDDDAVVAGGLQRSSEITAGGGSAESITGRRTEIDEACLGAARSQTGSSNRTGHADDDVLRVIGVDVERQLVEQYVFREKLSAPILAQQRLFGEIQIGKFPSAEIDAQDLSHVAARQSGLAIDRKKVRVIWIRGRHRWPHDRLSCSSRSSRSNAPL